MCRSCFQNYIHYARNIDKPIDVKAMGIGYKKLGAVYERMGEINKAIVCMQRSLVMGWDTATLILTSFHPLNIDARPHPNSP